MTICRVETLPEPLGYVPQVVTLHLTGAEARKLASIRDGLSAAGLKCRENRLVQSSEDAVYHLIGCATAEREPPVQPMEEPEEDEPLPEKPPDVPPEPTGIETPDETVVVAPSDVGEVPPGIM